MASILFKQREWWKSAAWHRMPTGRLLPLVLVLLGLILPTANAWAQG